MKEGWEIKNLIEVCDEITDGSHFSPKSSDEEEYPYITVRDIHQDKIDFIKCKFINRENYDLLAKNGCKPNNGDLLFSKDGTVGKVSLVDFDKDFVVLSSLAIIRPKKKIILPAFLKYIFKNPLFLQKAIGMKTGVAIRRIILKNLKQIEIRYPNSHQEQKRIVSTLDEVFAAIAKAKANAEQNLKNAKELFESYLQGVVENKGEGWGERKLGELCDNVQYGTSSKSKDKGKVAVLRMGNIQDNRFVWDKLVFTDNEEEIEKYHLRYNDVLFNRTNSPELVGKSAIYKGEQPAIFAGYLIRLNRKEDLIDADFLNYYLNSTRTRNYGFSVMSSSVNQANINGSKLKEYPIILPPLSDQQAIVQNLDALSAETKKLEAIYQKKIEELEELKKSILQKAFSGELKTLEAIAV